jgi:uncharacterized membrane protein
MITLDHVYTLAGLVFVAIAVLSLWDRANRKRLGNAGFWGLLAVSFLFGSQIAKLDGPARIAWQGYEIAIPKLGDFANGVIVLLLIVFGGFGLLGRTSPPTTTPEERRASAERRGDWLFIPALVIPVTALAGTIFLKTATIGGAPLLDAKQVTLISLAAGAVLALLVAMLWLRPPVLAPLQEGRRLIDTIGWAAVLPQMLASLGAVFALAGVGKAVGTLMTEYIPLDNEFTVVAAYCVGMALFTAIMGNAFAAFPVMTAAIGIPLILGKFDGNPAIMGAVGMLAGFCGTLTTPMAANFNIVPAALLDLPNRNAVIAAQFPTAIFLLAVNIALMYLLVFRF